MTTPLLALVDQLANHRVLVVGDVMLDRFVYGQVERISPEAPIPIMRIQRESVTLGGAGNVVRNLVALGGQVDLVGLIGQDQAGYDIGNILATFPSITSYLLTDPSRPTTLKTRYVAESQQLLRADHEVVKTVTPDIEEQILLRVRSALDGCSIVILSDYAKGVLSSRVVAETIKLAKDKGARVLIDPKGRDFRHYRGAYLLTPNRKELSEVAGIAIRTVEDAEKAARDLIAAHDLGGVLSKLSSDGVCLVMKGQPAVHFKATAREVFDVSGAGDTVLATLALSLAGGLSDPEAAELANLAGSIVVGKIGTATVSREELSRQLMYDRSRIGDSKLATLAELTDLAEQWRQQGLNIGFTNGCFDLLHPGHISLLKQAKTVCDKLIVGLNSDTSVRRLKGENRPIQNETSRAAVLGSLADVDHVVIFAEDTPVSLIKAIRPAVLIKGADYTVEEVVGADLLKEWGGKVFLATVVNGQSTSATIARLKGDKTALG